MTRSGSGGSRRVDRSSFAACTTGRSTRWLRLSSVSSVPGACRERRVVSGVVDSAGAVGQQFLAQPRAHVDLADPGLGLGVSDVDRPARESLGPRGSGRTLRCCADRRSQASRSVLVWRWGERCSACARRARSRCSARPRALRRSLPMLARWPEAREPGLRVGAFAARPADRSCPAASSRTSSSSASRKLPRRAVTLRRNSRSAAGLVGSSPRLTASARIRETMSRVMLIVRARDGSARLRRCGS